MTEKTPDDLLDMSEMDENFEKSENVEIAENDEIVAPEKNALADSHLNKMFKNYYLEYASYVNLDRAVPYFEDGFKPVQRRILHTLWEKNDGRHHKVANIIGHAMQYHPHGDASIGDALVNLGQKGLLVDPQGNWGNPVTGDNAAAPRYIEARLTPFAIEVLFNADTTIWVNSYDGRAKEPVTLPVKFPLLLAQGIIGIGVGLETKILSHNFNELCDASIAALKNKGFELYPDFYTGGIADVSAYNEGRRGGRVKVRAVIETIDKKTLRIKEIPWGTTTGQLIDSIVAANEKGKIKIRKVEDNTAAEVDIVIHLQAASEPLKVIESLFAFTNCEMSIAPNTCVVINKKPCFVSVKEMLIKSTEHTQYLLEWELKNKLAELENKWHMASLERIFIENKVYSVIEKAEDREQMIELVQKGLKPFLSQLRRDVTRDEILKLCEIPIRRISRFDAQKNKDTLIELDKEMAEVSANLANITEYTIKWFTHLKKTYGAAWPRLTKLESFHAVEVSKVAVADQKVYVNRADGFLGTSLKKEEFLFDCSAYDDILVFRKDGKMTVTKVSDKVFVGKGIVHIELFDKKDDRKIFNFIYEDGPGGTSYIKRFNVGGVTRDREYDLTKGTANSSLLYLSSNPNGEAEKIEIVLKPKARIKLNFNVDFAEIPIKGRGIQGNILTKYAIKSVKKTSEGVSTLGDQEYFYDALAGWVNTESKGQSIGQMLADDLILVLRDNGHFRLFEPGKSLPVGQNVLWIGRFDTEQVFCCLYWDSDKMAFHAKKTGIQGSVGTEYLICPDESQKALFVSADANAKILIEYTGLDSKIKREQFDFSDVTPLKSLRSLGQRLSQIRKLSKVILAPEAVLNGTQSIELALKKVPSLPLETFA